MLWNIITILQEIILYANLMLKKHFLFSMLKIVVLLNIFVKTMVCFFPEFFDK